MSLPSTQDLREGLALSRTFKYTGARREYSDGDTRRCEPLQFETWQEFEIGPAVANPLGAVGTVIDQKYRLHSLLGVGGMGSVYRVRHLLLDKQMALKTLRKATGACIAWQRFQREVQAIARLDHPNIVQVYDCGIWQGSIPYYTMELLRGLPLSEKLNKYGKISLENALPIFKAVAAALSHAHKHDIVHRDIKPGNIYLDHSQTDRTVVKVVDFGLAKLAAAQDYEGQATTGAGLVFGSPLYMSPEQASADETDWRTDIYSFGCAFFEALTGRPPFIGRTAFETIQMHLQDVPPLLVEANPSLGSHRQLENVMSKLLAKDVALRYQSFDDVLLDLIRLERSSSCVATHPVLASYPDDAEDDGPTEATNAANGLASVLRAGLGHVPVSRSIETSFISSTAVLLSAIMVAILSLIFGPNMQAVQTMQSSKSAILSCLPNAPLVTPNLPYFSSPSKAGGRIFNFPTNPALGYISIGGEPVKPAAGIIFVPQGSEVRLELAADLSRSPEVLAQFRPDDISILACRDYATWNEKYFDEITSHLTNLKVLELSGCDLGNDCVSKLNRLNDLVALSVGDTNITGHGLAELKVLRQLILLEASQLPDVSVTLRALKGGGAMKALSIADCTLSEADFANISTISSLTNLNVNHNQMSLENLKILSALPHLTDLAVQDTNLGPEAISIIHDFKKLKTLRIDTDNWTARDIEKLSRALPPDCTIASRKLYAGGKDFLSENWPRK